MKTRILLVDDHRLLLAGLQSLLEDQSDLEVVGVATEGRAAIGMAERLRPEVVVMDLSMPELNGIEATRRITESMPQCKILGMSAQVERRMIRELLKAGAKGFVEKTAATEELLSAIHTVLKGEVYLNSSVAGLLVDALSHNGLHESTPIVGLSNREREVLQLIAEGKTTKAVAATLHVSVKTAETHRRNLMEKLGMDSVADLTKLAIREGLTTL